MAGDGIGVDSAAHQRRHGEMFFEGNDAHGEVSFDVGISMACERTPAEFTK